MFEKAIIKQKKLILPSGHLTNMFLDSDRIDPVELGKCFSGKLENEGDLAFFVNPGYMPSAPLPAMGQIMMETRKNSLLVDLRAPNWFPVPIKGNARKKVAIVTDTIHLPKLFNTGLNAVLQKYEIEEVVMVHPPRTEHLNLNDPEGLLKEKNIGVRYLEEVKLPPVDTLQDLFWEEKTWDIPEYLRSTSNQGVLKPIPFYFWNLGDGIRIKKLLKGAKDAEQLAAFMIPSIVDEQRRVYSAGNGGDCVSYTAKTGRKFRKIYELVGKMGKSIASGNKKEIYCNLRDLNSKAIDFSDVKS